MLERCLRIAVAHRDRRIGDEHLLLALTARPGVPSEVLADQGVTYEALSRVLYGDGARRRRAEGGWRGATAARRAHAFGARSIPIGPPPLTEWRRASRSWGSVTPWSRAVSRMSSRKRSSRRSRSRAGSPVDSSWAQGGS